MMTGFRVEPKSRQGCGDLMKLNVIKKLKGDAKGELELYERNRQYDRRIQRTMMTTKLNTEGRTENDEVAEVEVM